jgi:hypothetical protein
VFGEIRVAVPLEGLEVVGGHDVNLALSRHPREETNLFRVARLLQTKRAINPIAHTQILQ